MQTQSFIAGKDASLESSIAAMQTKLKDPLSEFNRHELEDCFRRFQLRLETHLKSLLRDMRKQDPQGLAEVSRGASPVAQQAMRRADNDR